MSIPKIYIKPFSVLFILHNGNHNKLYAVHAKRNLLFSEGHCINSLWVALVLRARILREQLDQSAPLILGNAL